MPLSEYGSCCPFQACSGLRMFVFAFGVEDMLSVSSTGHLRWDIWLLRNEILR